MNEIETVKKFPEMSPELKSDIKRQITKKFNMNENDVEDVVFNRITLNHRNHKAEVEMLITCRKETK